MKKNELFVFFHPWKRTLKTLLVMKIIILLTGIFAFTLNASVFPQGTKMSIELKGQTIRQVLQEIEAISEYRFFYNDQLANLDDRVDFKVSNMSEFEAIQNLFEGQELTFELMENNLVLIMPASLALQNIISGTVTDESGAPLPGVSIVIKGTTRGAITNVEGEYTIQVEDPSTVLVFSYLGYLTQEIPVGDQTTINITLEEDIIGLEEVIVVGYGTQKKETLTGSISTVQSSDIIKAPIPNVSNSLGGRLPGLVSVTGSGEPGYDGTILRIRGSNTFNDNSVLVVVDGVPDRSLERIDPHSIESVTVLKDASAAIYGSRAANGVILITTKRGALGKPKLTLTIEQGFNQPTKIPEMADAATYATMLNEIEYYYFGAADMYSVYTADEIQKYRDGSDPLHYPNTDWFDEVLRPRSPQNSRNVTISGGTDAMKYFVSIGAKHQEGNYKNSAAFYDQYDFRSNIDGKITKDISIGFDIAGRLEDRNLPIYDGGGGIFRGLIQSYPNSVAVWPGGEPGPALEGGRNSIVTSTDIPGTRRDKYYKLNSNVRLDVNIPWVEGLSFRGNFSYDQGFDFAKTFSKPFELYTWDGTSVDSNGDLILNSNTHGGGNDNTPSLEESFITDYSKLLNGVLNYETRINENHNLKVMVGSEVYEGSNFNFSAYRDYFLSTAIEELFAGQTNYQRTDGSGSSNSRLSFFGRINYRFADKYLVEFIGRYDGSYIFPEDNRFGFFPGVSLGWVASEENFWKNNLSFINYFKLRGSWGQTGNDRVAAFQYLTSYLMGYQYNSAWNIPFVTYNGSAITENKTLYESVLANPDITWEVSNQVNIGFNARLLNNKLSIEADYFEYKRSNILWPQSADVPASAGITLPSANYGKASNKGFDGVITYADFANTNFRYSISFNAGYARNKVLEWGETEGVPEWQQTTGHPMGSGLYYKIDGIYHTAGDISPDITYEIGTTPEPGDVKFVDHNKDGVINADDRVRIYKNSIPTFTYGTNIDLNYKRFDLSILFQGAAGAVAYYTSGGGQFGNYLQSIADDRWTPDNTSTDKARTFNRANRYWVDARSEYWLRKTDYIRLKTLQFGYTLPSKSLQKIGIDKLRVYVSGHNLLLYCPDIEDFDPEIAANTTGLAIEQHTETSIDRDNASYHLGYGYPLQRVISLGLTVGF